MSDWNCVSCKIANRPNDTYCANCGAPRLRMTTASTALQEPGWRCGDCETVNRGPAESCTACGAPRARARAIDAPLMGVSSTVVVSRTAPSPSVKSVAMGKSSPESPPLGPATAVGMAAAPPSPIGHTTPKSRTPMIIATSVAVVLAAALIMVLIQSKHTTVINAAPTTTTSDSQPTGSSASSPTTVIQTVASQAGALNALISASAGARMEVAPAAADLENCGSPAADQAAFARAATTRQNVLNQLSTLSVSLLQSGQPMLDDLTSALNYSVQSDNAYARWAGDNLSSCSTDYNADPNFKAAQETDPQANTSKIAFANIWNAIAPQYGQPTWDPAKI